MKPATPTILISPAYGRVYPTLSKLKKAWDEGLDFKIIGGPYTSIRDVQSLLKDYYEIRVYKSYANMDHNSCLTIVR